MKLKGKRRLIICILLLVVVLVEFIAFRLGRSKGQNTKDIMLSLTEYGVENPLQDTIDVQAKYDDSGYYIVLPETINNKIVLKYYLEESKKTSYNSDTNVQKVNKDLNKKRYIQKLSNVEVNEVEDLSENNSIEEENNTESIGENKVEESIEEKEDENIVPEEIIDSSNEIESEIKVSEVLPGELYYLSDEEVENSKISLSAMYDAKEIKNVMLYSQVITEEVATNKVQIKGYFPNNAEARVSIVENEKVINSVDSILDENTSIEQLFSIKIYSDGKEFDCEKYGEKVKVRITVEDSKEKEYKIFEIPEDKKNNDGALLKNKNKISQLSSLKIKDSAPLELIEKDENGRVINSDLEEKNYALQKVANTDDTIDPSDIVERDVVIEDNAITFETNALGTIALLQTTATNGTETDTIEEVVTTGAKWDGTVATSFCGGDGTAQKPYLILEGSELAYLASQVNSGTSYSGQYFQLVGDIDLNNRTWTPIGDTNNSFKGIFDGAGHSISNGTIETAGTVSSGSTYNYGIFGTIQGDSTTAEIKNTEFNNINVNINNLANNSEVHVGIVTGTMYKNTKISNVLVKNGNIQTTRTISVSSNTMALIVGGIAGEARNTASSTTDPGEGNRYSIENCFASVTIDNDSISPSGNSRNSTYLTYVAQINTGGIIGRIRSQNVWPSNCLVSADITATGLIGPIFGTLLNNTDYTNYNNLNTLWNGNDAAGGNNLSMTSYYNTYRVNGTTFTSNYTNGNTPSTTTYRRNASITSGTFWATYNIGYLQGMNKGTRLANESSMLNNFNSYYSDDNINFKYTGGEFLLDRRVTAGVDDNGDQTYTITVEDPYNASPYTYEWYINDTLDTTKTSATEEVKNESFEDNVPVKVIVSDGTYYGAIKFAVPRLFVKIEFSIDYSDVSNFKINAELTGPGTLSSEFNINDYVFDWYELDIAGLHETKIEDAGTLTLSHVEEGLEYKLVATNNRVDALSAVGSTVVGERNVVYVAYATGRDTRLGDTPETSVKTLDRAYNLISSSASRNKNIIVIMENYATAAIYEDDDSNTFNKNATITGAYAGIRYSPLFYLYGTGYRYLLGDTTFQYLDFYGGNSSLYLYAQGYDLTMGEEITMRNYTAAASNQGLTDGAAPAVHIFGGWCRYNRSTLPANESNGTRTKAEILIKSGTYGRIIGGGAMGSSGSYYLYNTTSNNFLGSSLDRDPYNIEITVDIENSTTDSNYSYDVNLLVGGSASGNTYGNSIVNIENGSIGRVLGGSIGNSSYAPNNRNTNVTSNANWRYPTNTYIGSATINMNGGTVSELYGGCLGRNMAVTTENGTGRICDSYFYGDIHINISGGTVSENIYGAGAGAVTGYSSLSSDPYKNYGDSIDTTVNINITGGNINSNIYGGGYGYTAYLKKRVTPVDCGTLYGNSIINISGGNITGSVYGAGCGYDYDYEDREELAQFYGDSEINITGFPTITGNIFGAGAGISGLEEMAKHEGKSVINIDAPLTCDVYGGGNIAKLKGDSEIYINQGEHSGNIFGGGNVGIVDGKTYVQVNGENNTGNIYGGGNQATVTETVVDIKNGTNNNSIFGGGNEAPVGKSTVNILGGTNKNVFGCGNKATSNDPVVYIKTDSNTQNVYGGGNETDAGETKVYLEGGTATNIYGGSNASGTVSKTNVVATSGTATSIYGGNNAGGTVSDSNVTVDGGTIETVFGGNNAAGTTTVSHVIINNSVTNVYGGNNLAGTTGTSNITVNHGTINKVFGGGNRAGIDTKSDILVLGGIITDVYGGSNDAGDVAQSNVKINATSLEGNSTYNVVNVYGGNNNGGQTLDPKVTIQNGTISNVFGGGNNAVVPKTEVKIENGTIDNVYGGGNNANVNGDTNLQVLGGTINTNVYGGGNEGPVTGNSNATIQNATVLGSGYGGGNGVGAIVIGNSTLNVLENAVIGSRNCTVPVQGSVFGGGNAASTGTSNNSGTSRSILNVVGGTIYGNTYGGANTAVVYGKAILNIGKKATGNEELTQGNIHIYGTAFGGGEANAEGSDTFDWDTIIVTDGIDVTINAEGYTDFLIDGSIFGSGNASATSGTSTVNVKNYGTATSPKYNISLQRANLFIIDNSAISLDGASDRANEYSSYFYSISRIDHLILQNNACLYMNFGANLLKNYTSRLVTENGEELETVTIDEETGETTKNVDNRIYLLEGNNLNIATNERATAYGNVNGMTFLGIYTSIVNPSASSAYYAPRYNNGDEIRNAGTFSMNSYVLGAHKDNHDIKVDGFYTNINNEGTVKCEYVGVTPEDDTYYLWYVGDAVNVTVFNITLTASKYATLGTLELPLTGFSTPNSKYILSGYTVAMKEGIELIDHNDIPAIAETEEEANSKFGLNMKNGKTGWISNNSNNFMSADEGYFTGSTTYQSENTSTTPALTFCLYHAQNITTNQALGNAKIRFQALIPENDLKYRMEYIDVIVTMISDTYQNDFYEAAITPGEEFELFTTTETNITNKSTLSTYYSLFIPNFSENDIYDDYQNYDRCLVSRNLSEETYILPKNTKITMLDLVTHTTYYYVVTEDDVTSGKYIYKLTDFVKMGSTNEKYNPSLYYNDYYNSSQDILYENYIFQMNFSETGLTSNQKDKTLFMELQDENGETLIGVLGIERETTKYSVYTGQDATIKAEAETVPETIYLGNDIDLTVKTNYKQKIVNTNTIFDTAYFNQKPGIKITIFDSAGNQLNSDSLMGVFFELDGNRYYPRIDGTTRIKIADRVSNVLSKITINTSQNTTLATGSYKIQIETFGSSDGIYYGLEASDSADCTVYIINGAYGLKVRTDDEDKIVNKDTGKNQDSSNKIDFNIEYSSNLDNPIIAVSLERRDYTSIYSDKYNQVDLKDYVSDNLVDFVENEYKVADNPRSAFTHSLTFKQNLTTGTYKVVYKLYDGNTYIGEVYEYIIIR